jgi:protocatechuate 3,4-dioxygenase beta subunit
MSALAVLLALFSVAGAQAPPKPAEAAKTPASTPARKVPKPAPPPVTSLEVVVTNPTGKPVEGAFVMAVPAQGAYRAFGGLAPEKVRSTVTGREGKARLESLPPGPWNVTVHARGFVTQPTRRVASGPIAVRLERGGVITGVVREGEGNRPIAAARVAVESNLSTPEGWSAEATRNETVTDAEGRFRLEGIGRAPVRLSARARGLGRAERSGVRAGASVELFLFPGSTLAGTVRDDGARPVKGATVRAAGDTSWNAPPAERTDERGEFELAGIAPGEYTVVAREGGRAPGIASVVVEPEGEATVSLTVSDGGYVTGRIVDPTGRPLPGRVRLEVFEDRGLPDFASDGVAAEARADGTFALGPVPLGSLGIGVSAPGHASRRVDALIPARARTVDVGDVALDPGLAIRGRVRDRQGDAIDGATVRALGQEPGEAGEAEATSGPDGRFDLGGLRPGRHQVSASAPGFATAFVTAEAGGEPVDVVMDAGGTIAGRVVDAEGSAVEEAQVTAQAEGESRGPGGYHGARADEGDGRFLIPDVAPGTYELGARASGRGEAARAGVRVAPGRTTDVGTLALARGGTVQGVVVDSEGRGIPGATVHADRDANRRTGELETQTGSTGAFELTGVPIGPVHVSARHLSYAASAPVVAEVDPEKENSPVRIVLARGGRVEGRALHRDGRPFTGGRVHAWSLDGRGSGGGWEAAPIDGDGSFVMEHVPAGRMKLDLMAFTPSSPMVSGMGGGNILTTVASREVEIRDGETVSVDLALRDVVMSGRVTRGGQPEAGVLVGVMSGQGSSVMAWVGPPAARAVAPSGPPPLNAVTREDGSYELLVFTPGLALVQMRSGGQQHPGRQVEIPDTDRFPLDLEIGGVTVSGLVVDRETGEPVPEAYVSLLPAEGQKTQGGSAQCGLDGRFSVSAEPGEYRLQARARDRQPALLPLSVGPSGLSDLRVEMDRGLQISGRLVDSAGRAAPGFLILVTPADGEGSGHADSGADGSFRIGGLGSTPHALVGGSELAGYAFRPGVIPGGEPLALTLRPAGRIRVRVVDPAGQPVREAYPRVEAVDGVRVRMPGRTSGPTDANGLYELACPPGAVEVVARGEKGTGRGTVTVPPGGTVSLTIVLQKEAPKGSGLEL